MPFVLIQAGTDLQFLNVNGDITTLTLPTGVTISDQMPPRWEVMTRQIVMVNSPSVPLAIDGGGNVRPLAPTGPSTAPTVSAASGGTLSGTYTGIRYTFITKNASGEVISESALSPAAGTVTVSNQRILVSGLELSTSGATGRRLYRPATDGAALFKWIDLDNNTSTSISDDTPDAALSIIAAPTLGSPPNMYLVKEWRNRLWGVAKDDRDTLRYAQVDAFWAWPSTNGIKIPIVGSDELGIRALMPRKEFLGIGKRDSVWYISGTTPTDFRVVKLSGSVGVESQESVVTFSDTVWWLWKDGVYQWNAEGVVNITEDKVKSWFTTDTYFNRDLFDEAFAVFDTRRMKYKLYLASAGSTEIDTWIEYDTQTKSWWGPHSSTALTPTSAFTIFDSADKNLIVTGSEAGYVWKETTAATDHLADGIEVDFTTKWMTDNGDPNGEKHFGQLTVMGKPQTAGQMAITPYTGYTNAPAQAPLFYDMTKGREVLDRLGHGMFVKLRFTHSTYNEPIQIHGLEIPYNNFGVR